MFLIEYFLRRLIRKGHLQLISGGKVIDLGDPNAGPPLIVRFHDNNLLFKLAQDFALHFGEAYMDGRLTIEQGTLYDVLELFALNYNEAPLMIWDLLSEWFSPWLQLLPQQDALSASRKNVAHHYDYKADFFKLFLDQDMQYSCAYFNSEDDDLDAAQTNKKRLLAAKLALKPGMQVLDIGCGFGGLAFYLAKNFGVKVTGITLSQEQLKVALERLQDLGLADQVEFRLQDYRQETKTYDRIVSVGMFEHVGVKNYPEFFACLKRLLKDDGIALLHSIGRSGPPGTIDAWMDKYIFPGGYAPSLSQVFPGIEKSDLWVTDMEIWQSHYAKTLTCWRNNFNRNRQAVQQMYDERFCRMWEFYLIGAEMEFRYGPLMIFHLQMAKKRNIVPATRDYMFERTVKSSPVQAADIAVSSASLSR